MHKSVVLMDAYEEESNADTLANELVEKALSG